MSLLCDTVYTHCELAHGKSAVNAHGPALQKSSSSSLVESQAGLTIG